MHAHRFSLFACAFLLLAACGDPTTEADDPGLKVCEGELALTCVDWGLDGNDRFACIEYACARPGEDPVDPAGASEDGVFGPIRRPVADFTRVHLSADEGADAGDDAGEGAGDAPAMDDEPADDGQESPADAPAAGADEADAEPDPAADADEGRETAEAWPDAEAPDGDRPDPEAGDDQ